MRTVIQGIISLIILFHVSSFIIPSTRLHISIKRRLSGNINEFASSSLPTPSISSTEDNLEVDFEELSKESAEQAYQPKIDLSDLYVKEERKAPRQAQWLPLLLSPPALDGSLAGGKVSKFLLNFDSFTHHSAYLSLLN